MGTEVVKVEDFEDFRRERGAGSKHMAGDWMAIDLDLPEKEETQRIIELTGEPLEVVLGRLVLFWRWVDRQSANGALSVRTLSAVVRIAGGTEDFWKSLCDPDVDWLRVTKSGLEIPGFEKRFSKSAKRRLLENRRKSAFRAQNGRNVSASNALPEKRREDIKKETKAKKERPTFEQVRAYCLERNNGIDPEEFIDHYKANGWVQGKGRKPIVDWKAAVRTWEKNRKPQQRCLVPTAEDLANYNPVTGGGDL